MKLLEYYLYNGQFYSSDELYHWGVKGMKWGVRRYQNKDGTLTPAGKKRIRQGFQDADIAQKYKAKKDSEKQYYDIADTEEARLYSIGLGDSIEENDPELFKLIDTTFTRYLNAERDYNTAFNSVSESFKQEFGNAYVSEIHDRAAEGEKEVRRLLKEYETDKSVWDANIDAVRRSNYYSDKSRLVDAKYSRDLYDEADKVLKETLGSDASASTVTRKSVNDKIRTLEKQVRKEKRYK